MTTIKTLFAATALVIVPALAHAAPAGYESVSIQVRTDDLNLATPSGRDTLDRRIESAARDACGASYGNVGLSVRQAQKSCMTQARQAAQSLAQAKISRTGAFAAK